METVNEEIKHPVTKMVWFYILLVLAGLVVASAISGCGTRNASSKVTQTEATRDAKEVFDSKTSETSQSAATRQETAQSTKTSEAARTTTEKQYDPATGRLIGEKTTTETQKKAGTKTRNFVETTKKDINRLHDINRVITTHVTETTSSKDKDTERSNTLVQNIGGPWVMLGIVLIIALVIAGYKYITRKRVPVAQ